jgi:hypothetical protein
MLRSSWVGVLSLAGLAVLAPAGRAEVVVRTRFVTVAVGRAPAPAPVLVPAPPPVVVPADLPPPRVVPPPPPAPVQALTVAEFAAAFQPVPGTHKVVLIHPVTGCPVEVCFTLPPGCPKVKVHRRELEFDYGRREVEIHFRHGGRVEVDYD